MCSCSGVMGWIGKAAKLIICLFAINAGLAAAGIYDFFAMPSMMASNTSLYIHYLVGISGVYCLVMTFMHGMFCKCGMK